jgi:hypothetical protein
MVVMAIISLTAAIFVDSCYSLLKGKMEAVSISGMLPSGPFSFLKKGVTFVAFMRHNEREKFPIMTDRSN